MPIKLSDPNITAQVVQLFHEIVKVYGSDVVLHIHATLSPQSN